MNKKKSPLIDISDYVYSIKPLIYDSLSSGNFEEVIFSKTGFIPVLNKDLTFFGLTTLENATALSLESSEALTQRALLDYETVINPVSSNELRRVTTAMSHLDEKESARFVLFDSDGQFVGVLDSWKLLSLGIDQTNFDLNEAEDNLTFQTKLASELEAELVSLRKDRLSEVKIDKFNDIKLLGLLSEFGFEAKTPMTNIMSLFDLMRESELTSVQQKMLGSASSNLGSLFDLIEGFRDFASSEVDGLNLSNELFSTEDEFCRSVDLLSEVALMKSVSVECQSNLNAGLVSGDPSRFRRVLSSLAGSVIERMISGKLLLRAYDERTEAGWHVSVQISTESSCFTDEEVESIFNPSSSAQALQQRETFVMKTCRNIIEAMGGRLKICGYPNAGNILYEVSFIFEENRVGVMDASSEPEAPEHVEAVFEELDLLVIDDNKINLDLLSRVLRLKGCNVHEASSGSEGLRVLNRYPIDGVLMDCQMPELSGYEVAELIRSGDLGPECQDVCIAAITATDYETAKRLVDQAGMDFLLCKPIRGEKLDQLILDVANHSANRLQVRESACEIV